MRHIAKHGIQNLEARAEIPNGEDGTLHPPEYQLAMVDEQHDSSRLVMERFVSKYGREHDFIVSLVVSTRTTRV
ncbi:MAG TPA: hypothetical protein VOB72_09150, partial [Candidatus Dormibacteraeota bacterium]|nr:hypothetical protein [Candidatus Dormibacteraeota bacterium]